MRRRGIANDTNRGSIRTATMKTGSVLPNNLKARIKRPEPHPHAEARVIARCLKYKKNNHFPVLFHGTRCTQKILNENTLLSAGFYSPTTVSMSRRLSVAVHFACLPRDDQEDYGGVLVLNQHLLAKDYVIYTFSDPSNDPGVDEQEFITEQSILGLDRYLIDVLWISPEDLYPDWRLRKRLSAGSKRMARDL